MIRDDGKDNLEREKYTVNPDGLPVFLIVLNQQIPNLDQQSRRKLNETR
jgi:hypothetical protein